MSESEDAPDTLRVHAFLERRRWALLAAFIVHCIAMHYAVIGFVSWDGLGYRTAPVIELVKHGGTGLDKFTDWTFKAARPFLELIHAPFLGSLGLRGLYFSFALTLFPLCVAGMFLFVRSVTGRREAGLYAAATYALVPMVNSQIFAGYVDWAIPALLAFMLYALIEVGRSESPPSRLAYARVLVATFVFTKSRQQAPYLALVFLAVIIGSFFVERSGRRLKLRRTTVLLPMLASFTLGWAPSVIAQAVDFVRYGSPIHPFQLNLFGLRIGESPVDQAFLYDLAGLKGHTARGYFESFRGSWLVPETWPHGFFDSRFLGGGLFMITSILTTPLWLRRANRETRVVLAACVMVSVVIKDFWLPRYAYALMVVVCTCNGLAIAYALDARWPRHVRVLVYGTLLAALGVHALRPEWDIYRIGAGDYYPRVNLANSPHYMAGGLDIPVYPDEGRRFVIALLPANGFVVPIYGRNLTNTIAGAVKKEDLGSCASFHAWDVVGDEVLVIDDHDFTKDCPRSCAMTHGSRCLAYRLVPGPPN